MAGTLRAQICFTDSLYAEGSAEYNADFEGAAQAGTIEFMSSSAKQCRITARCFSTRGQPGCHSPEPHFIRGHSGG